MPDRRVTVTQYGKIQASIAVRGSSYDMILLRTHPPSFGVLLPDFGTDVLLPVYRSIAGETHAFGPMTLAGGRGTLSMHMVGWDTSHDAQHTGLIILVRAGNP